MTTGSAASVTLQGVPEAGVILKSSHRERLVADTVHAATEAVTFDELGHRVMPLLERLFETRSSLLYRSDAACPVVPVCKSDMANLAPTYVRHYLSEDPLQAAIKRTNPWIAATNRSPEWAQYVGGPSHDYWLREDMLYFFHGRLLEGSHYSPGMVGYVLARAPGQPPFSVDDEALAARLLPALQGAAHRITRTLTSAQAAQTLEGLIEGCDRPPTLAADLSGRLLWASPGAGFCLAGLPRAALPEPLSTAAREMSADSRQPDSDPRRTVPFQAPDGGRVSAQLRLCRPCGGEPFIAIELERPGIDSATGRVAERHGLTPAEARVLSAIARGSRDQEIAAATHTSIATVRTHVTRILSKLGVRSRVEAALLARGAPVGQPAER